MESDEMLISEFEKQMIQQTLLTIEPGRTLDRALHMMVSNNIRHLPVVTKHTGELVGIISERDLRLASVSPILEKDMKLEEAMKKLSEHKVSECMSTNIHTVNENDTILVAAKLMRVSKRGALPVMSATNPKKIVGIITRIDMLDHLIRILEPLQPENSED
jgi:CBS domain-containing protein